MSVPDLAIALALAWGAGLRAYAVIFAVGLAGAMGWVELPGHLEVLQHPVVLAHGILGFDRLKLGALKNDYFRGVPARRGLLPSQRRRVRATRTDLRVGRRGDAPFPAQRRQREREPEDAEGAEHEAGRKGGPVFRRHLRYSRGASNVTRGTHD